MLDRLMTMRSSRPSTRTFIAMSTALLLAVVPISIVAADDEAPNLIENVWIVSTSIDAHTHLPTAVVSLTCLQDASVRIRLTLTQDQAGGPASSQQTSGLTCVAGTAPYTSIVFGPQQGRFRPGRADLFGFAAATPPVCCSGDDLEEIQAPDVFLAPHRRGLSLTAE
jgi:hypothetical protein